MARALCCLLAAGSVEGSASPGRQEAGSLLARYRLEEDRAAAWRLPRRLDEISGLAMTGDGRLLAHDDEAAIVYEIDFRDGSVVKAFQLADLRNPIAGDFEGIAVVEARVYLVTSSGRLYEFAEGADGESVLFRVYATGVGRDCEIEGLAYDDGARALLLLCKEARSAELRDRLAIHRWSVDDRRLLPEARTVIREEEFARRLGSRRFHPSGIERHPVSGNYFVVAARQAAIAEVTPGGEVLAVRPLAPRRHRQAEGITFAPDGALIVSDEARGARARLTVYPPLRRAFGAPASSRHRPVGRNPRP